MPHQHHSAAFLSLGTVVLSAALLWSSLSWAGNAEMVQKSVEELEEVNKDALGQIEDLPAQGQVDLKAQVTTRDGKREIEILEKNITKRASPPPKINSARPDSASKVIEKTIDFTSSSIPQGAQKKP